MEYYKILRVTRNYVVEEMDKQIPQHAVNVKEQQIYRHRSNIDAILEVRYVRSVLTNLNDEVSV